MSKIRIITAKTNKHLATVNEAKLGLGDSQDTIDIGIASCHDGRYLVKWGENLERAELVEGRSYVRCGVVTTWTNGIDYSTRPNFATIISKVS